MHHNNLRYLFLAALWVITPVAAQAAEKLDYPTRPVRLIVPFAPGGSVDISSRVLAGPLSELLGQQVVVDNRSGASGSIGAAIVAKAAPDGYTLVAGSSGSMTANRAVYSNLPYDSLRDFVPISMINITPMVIVTYPGLPVTTVKELIELARTRPGKIAVASAGTGTSNHLALELFQSKVDAKYLHVPFKGTGAAYTDLIGGQVHVMFDQIASAIGHVNGGRLRAIAVTTLHRSSVLPNTPTVDESGVKGYDAASFTGILAPARTPQKVVDRLHAAVVKAAQHPAVLARFKELAADPKTTTQQEFSQFMREDIAKWQKVAQLANIKLD